MKILAVADEESKYLWESNRFPVDFLKSNDCHL